MVSVPPLDLIAYEKSRPSSLPALVASRETPLGPGAKKDGCFRRLYWELRRPKGPPSGAPYPYRKLKEILMVIRASGIARGCIRTTTVESRKMAAILQIIG